MNRPDCTCRDGHHCRPCVLIATRVDYVSLWNVPAEDAEAVRARLGKVERAAPKAAAVKGAAEPCIHVGASVYGDEWKGRDWHRCDHPQRIKLDIAEVVCSCRGCNPKCRGYE